MLGFHIYYVKFPCALVMDAQIYWTIHPYGRIGHACRSHGYPRKNVPQPPSPPVSRISNTEKPAL